MSVAAIMANATIPLPPELILSVLKYCTHSEISNFARTSAYSCDISVPLLYQQINLVPLIATGAFDGRLAEFAIHSHVRVVELHVGFPNPEFWAETNKATEAVIHHLGRFSRIEELHIICAPGGSFVPLRGEKGSFGYAPVLKILQYIFTDLLPKLSILFLEFDIPKRTRPQLDGTFAALKDTLNSDTIQELKLKTAKIWMTALSPRCRDKAKDPEAMGTYQWVPDARLDYLAGRVSDKVKHLVIEDKFQNDGLQLCQSVANNWKNLQSLELDLGIMSGSDAQHYSPLEALKSLKKLHVTFSYLGWDRRRHRNDMKGEAEFLARALNEEVHFLPEVGIKYIAHDCSKTETIIFECTMGLQFQPKKELDFNDWLKGLGLAVTAKETVDGKCCPEDLAILISILGTFPARSTTDKRIRRYIDCDRLYDEDGQPKWVLDAF
ncbi:hypothetical protein TWF694_007275 [Orbilia ellipsospora]|uniref:F-box domain-containing protein n=1 Tax=Orbilia ellipsospora TaxID=2528407 RepID=A0AAV9XIQ4_9PEZI